VLLTRQQRILAVEHYFRNESYALCKEAFQELFPSDTVPNKTTIYRIITKFEETGSVCGRTHNLLEDARLSLLLV
jgi:hypothetical protein